MINVGIPAFDIFSIIGDNAKILLDFVDMIVLLHVYDSNSDRDDVLKVRVDCELTTLRLWPLMTLLSRTAGELYRLDCDGILSSDSESSGRVSSCYVH